MTIDRFHGDKPCRVLVFANPKAGSGSERGQLARLLSLLETSPAQHTEIGTPEELIHQVRQSQPDCRVVVVAAGGDGTLSLAASTLGQATAGSEPVPLLPMPLGTENLLARQFGHRANATDVMKTLQHGTDRLIDSGTANGRCFLIMMTCGFDAEVVRAVDLKRTGHIWRLSYASPIFRAMRRYQFPALRVRIDDQAPTECRWAMVFNLPKYAGGLNIMPHAVGDDGQLDVVMFDGGSIPSGLRYVSGIWTRRHLNFRDVHHVRGRRVQIESDQRVPFQLDGDYAGKLPASIDIHPQSVRLLMPVG